MAAPRRRPEASSAGGLPVAVDAMGGDNAPGEIVAGACLAVEELGIPVVLVGDPAQIGDTGGLEVLAASEVIAMDDDPGASVRRKKDSSLVARGALERRESPPQTRPTRATSRNRRRRRGP